MYGEPHSKSTSLDVVYAVADATGYEPTALPPLGDFIDTDALDTIVGSTAADGDRSPTVRFEYAGHEVVVRDGGNVIVEPKTATLG